MAATFLAGMKALERTKEKETQAIQKKANLVSSWLLERKEEIRERMLLTEKTNTTTNVNNIIEQDHRFIKKVTKQMKGFKSIGSASATLDGIEVAHMIRKQQFGTSGQPAFQQFAALAG